MKSSDNNFDKDLSEIMADYGDENGEWETVFIRGNDGKVKKFKHNNGKYYFCVELDEDTKIQNESLLQKLSKGKTIEKQMEHFYLTESKKLSRLSYGQITKEQISEETIKLSDYDITHLIIKNNVLVGAMVNGYWGVAPLYPGEAVCTYYASDNNGSGSNDREDYIYLLIYDK